MSAELLARLGGPSAAAGLALLVLASPRQARLAGLGLWAGGMALFVPLLLPAGEGARLLAGGALGIVVAAGLAFVISRRPWALAFLTLAAAPARLPIHVGNEKANLLVPLYVVVGGAAIWLGWSLWRDGDSRRELGALSWPLAAFVAWIGLSALWTNDLDRGTVELCAFVMPFGLLAVAVARLPWSGKAITWLCRLFLAMGLLFAAVGIWQWATRDVFWNPKVLQSNAYASFYRVNSLFWDPSIYGRFLVLALLLALAVLLFGPWRRWDLPLTVAVVVLWVGLLFSFSQSSFAALIAGVLVAGGLAWRRGVFAAAALGAAVVLSLGVVHPGSQTARAAVLAASAGELNRATAGRFDLVKNGITIALDHPVLGVGVGGFTKAYRESVEVPRRVKTPASHTTPVTVAAETGIVGLALFGWLVVAGLAIAFRGAAAGPPAVAVVGLSAGLGLTALFVHSLFYNALFEDPLTWAFLSLATLAARAGAERG